MAVRQFLELRGALLKMHGSSDALAVKQTIMKAIPYVEGKVVEIIESSVLEIEDICNGRIGDSLDRGYRGKKFHTNLKDKNLLATALTHSSYAGQFNKHSNERLEFIGDGFLDAVIGFDLFTRLADNSEGTLSKRRAQIVCSDSLAEIGLN